MISASSLKSANAEIRGISRDESPALSRCRAGGIDPCTKRG